jgi:hypothetical protein
MRHTERVERTTRCERRGRERAFGEWPCEVSCAREGDGARPYNVVTQFVATFAFDAGWLSSTDLAESTWAASAVHAPCTRWDGDPVAAWKEEWRRRLRGDKVGWRPMEEMRGFELVGTSSAAAPPGRTRALARVSIAKGFARTKV